MFTLPKTRVRNRWDDPQNEYNHGNLHALSLFLTTPNEPDRVTETAPATMIIMFKQDKN